MKTVLTIDFTGLAKGLSIDETGLAEPDLAGVLPSVGDILVTTGWPGNDRLVLVCRSRRLTLAPLQDELHVHIVLDMAPPGSADR